MFCGFSPLMLSYFIKKLYFWLNFLVLYTKEEYD